MDKGAGFSHWMRWERKMSFTHTIFNGIPQPSCLSVSRNGSRFITKASKRKENGGPNSSNQQLPRFPLKVSNTVIARSVVVVLGLGFIDAGYSGDWSRIGVISKDVEDLLKIAAFLSLHPNPSKVGRWYKSPAPLDG